MKYDLTIPKQIQDRVFAKVDETVKRLQEHYPFEQLQPITSIDFDKKGRTAGTATYSTRHLSFNRVLLMENVDEFINRTVPHEAIHVLSYDIYGRDGVGHGRIWKHLMTLVGADNSRCHSYDTSNAQVRTKNKFVYHCDCGTPIIVSSTIHNRVRNQQRSYACRTCGTSLKTMKWERVGQVSYREAAQVAEQNKSAPKTEPTPTPEVTKAPELKERTVTDTTNRGSKKYRAIGLYNSMLAENHYLKLEANKSILRKHLIELYMSELGMTKAGASTYAYNIMNNK